MVWVCDYICNASDKVFSGFTHRDIAVQWTSAFLHFAYKINTSMMIQQILSALWSIYQMLELTLKLLISSGFSELSYKLFFNTKSYYLAQRTQYTSWPLLKLQQIFVGENLTIEHHHPMVAHHENSSKLLCCVCDVVEPPEKQENIRNPNNGWWCWDYGYHHFGSNMGASHPKNNSTIGGSEDSCEPSRSPWKHH